VPRCKRLDVTRKAIAEKDMEISDIELAELRKKAHAHDSEQGRLQKTQQELDAERTQRAELEKRLAAAQQQNLPAPDARALEIFGPEGVSYLQNMLKPLEQIGQKIDTIGKRFDEQASNDAQARALRTFQDTLNTKLADRNLPGFASRLFGGDLAAVWSKFVEGRPSVRRAQSEGDVEAVSDVIATFIQQNKELVAGGGFSPTAVSSLSPAVKCDYTDADYSRDAAVLQGQLENLTITEQEFKAKGAGLYSRWVAAQEKVEQAAAAYGLV